MGDRNPITVLVNWPIHPRPLPHPPVHLPNWVRGRTIPIIPCHGLPAYVLMPRQFQVDVRPTRPCWHVVRKPMVDRLVERVLRRCPIHLPWPQRTRPLPLPRRLLPSQAKVPTIPTTHWLGLLEFVLPPYQFQVDVRPTPACWHAARLRMADRRAGLALRRYHLHPRVLLPILPRLHPRRPPPSQEKEPTIPTTHWLGLQEFVLPPYQYPVDVPPTPVC